MKTHQPTQKKLLSGNIQGDESAPYYHAYLNLSRGADLFKRLQDGKKNVLTVAGNMTDKQALFRYKEEKWSIKQMLGHMIDTERIMSYRALAFARNEKEKLPGYDHNDYVNEANFDDMSLDHLLNNYCITRDGTISLFRSFTSPMLMRTGSASNCRFTVRALGFIIAGHELHHLNIIRTKYLPQLIA